MRVFGLGWMFPTVRRNYKTHRQGRLGSGLYTRGSKFMFFHFASQPHLRWDFGIFVKT
jgi:hypothetical protein